MVEAHRLAAWRDDFLVTAKQGLKGQEAGRGPDDRALKVDELRQAVATYNTQWLVDSSDTEPRRRLTRTPPRQLRMIIDVESTSGRV
jgi:hypothetical protein